MTDKPTKYNRGRFQLKYRGTECLNCGHPLDMSDRYCPNCAQANSTKNVSIRDFFDEFFSNILSYDSRLLRTLSAMLLHPGRISKEYVEGKRMRYTNPFRFMLSLAIIYFLMLGLSGDFSALDRIGQSNDTLSFDPAEAISMAIQEGTAEQEEALQLIDSVVPAKTYKELRRIKDSLIVHDPGGYFGKISDSNPIERIGQKSRFFMTLMERDSIFGFQSAVQKYAIPDNMENKMSYSIAGSIIKVAHQPGSFLNSLTSRLPFATFFFLPLFAFFIALVYIRKKYTYTDNLIFSFHNQSLLFILLIVSFLVDTILKTSTNWIALTVFSVFLYLAMRNFYGQGHFKTILKYLFLNAVFFILAAVAGLIFVLASAFTY